MAGLSIRYHSGVDEHGGRRAEGLSPRELQLLSYAAQGFTDKAISNKLGISLATIGTYWGRIRIKFGPLNRTELVANWLKEQASEAVQQLQTDNELLMAQVSEYAKVEQMLKATLELMHEVIDVPVDAILIVNEAGTIELANEQAERMFGYRTGELAGVSVEALVPKAVRDQHVANRLSYNENPVRKQMNDHLGTEALREDGSTFPIASLLSATHGPSGLLVTCVIRDLTAQLEAVAAQAEEADR